MEKEISPIAKERGKKVLLVIPNLRWKRSMDNILWHYIPYGLCMIAAVIEKDYDVKIVDAHADDLTEEAFLHVIRQEKPDVVGISVLMDYFGKTAHTAARIVKQAGQNIITVIGGVYATTNIEKAMEDANFDYLIAGEGEYAFRDLLLAIFSGGGVARPELEGIYYWDNTRLVGTGRAKPIEDLDSLPFPAYHLLNYDKYTKCVSRNSVDRPYHLPYARILTSRGCPFQCCFCQVGKISGRGFRARSAENVLREIDWLIDTYHVRSIIFDDDNFFTDRKRAKKIMEGLVGRNIEWKMIATAAFLLDDELIELMKKSGCRYMDIAVESGSYRILREVIHKPINFDQVKRVVAKAKQEGIYVAANFIVGFPTETWDEIRETLKFAEEIDVDYAKIFNAVPLPNTELFELATRMNCLASAYDPENIDWKTGMIETDEFSVGDLTILRAYEWDRINFTDPRKRKKTMEMMNITEEELNQIRKNTRRDVRELIRA